MSTSSLHKEHACVSVCRNPSKYNWTQPSCNLALKEDCYSLDLQAKWVVQSHQATSSGKEATELPGCLEVRELPPPPPCAPLGQGSGGSGSLPSLPSPFWSSRLPMRASCLPCHRHGPAVCCPPLSPAPSCVSTRRIQRKPGRQASEEADGAALLLSPRQLSWPGQLASDGVALRSPNNVGTIAHGHAWTRPSVQSPPALGGSNAKAGPGLLLAI